MNHASLQFDILVVGAGPAGLAAAAALSQRGLRVGCLAPQHPPRWPNTYGLWLDELETLGLQDCVDIRWDKPTVVAGANTIHRLPRSYARLDNKKLIARLIKRAEGGNITWLTGVARDWARISRGVEIVASPAAPHQSPRCYEARAVIDATGHFPALLKRASRVAPAWQTAWGIMAHCKGDPILGGASMALMDFSAIDGESTFAEPPSFLYAMNMGGGRYFLEETVLASRPAFKIERLQHRLATRLEMRGVEVVEVLETERVAFPMGLDLPISNPFILGFGGAASMVHPATGYMVGRALQAAQPLAFAIAEELGRAGGDPMRAVAAGREAIWPQSTRRSRELLLFGLETLLKLNADETRVFFNAFFRLAPAQWAAYLSGTASPAEITQMMLEVFRHLPPALKIQFARAGFSKQAAYLLRASGPSFLTR